MYEMYDMSLFLTKNSWLPENTPSGNGEFPVRQRENHRCLTAILGVLNGNDKKNEGNLPGIPHSFYLCEVKNVYLYCFDVYSLFGWFILNPVQAPDFHR